MSLPRCAVAAKGRERCSTLSGKIDVKAPDEGFYLKEVRVNRFSGVLISFTKVLNGVLIGFNKVLISFDSLVRIILQASRDHVLGLARRVNKRGHLEK